MIRTINWTWPLSLWYTPVVDYGVRLGWHGQADMPILGNVLG